MNLSGTVIYIAIAFFYCSSSYSQVAIKEIREENPTQKNVKYTFPLAVYPSNPTVARKINAKLFSDILKIDPAKVKKSIFENVWATKERSGGLFDISYKINANSGNIFTVAISGEGCGAYCEYGTSDFSFDLRDGRIIMAKDFFNANGQNWLVDQVNNHRKKTLVSNIQRVEKLLITKKKFREGEQESLTAEKELYVDCLEREPYKSLEYVTFYLNTTRFFVGTGSCSAHYNRAVDDIGDFNFSAEILRSKKYLSKYALSLLKLSN